MLLLLLPHLEPHSRFTWAGEAAASTSACRIARSIIFGDASSSSPRKYETSFDTPYPSVAARIRCRRLRAAIGAQRQAHRPPNTQSIGKRSNTPTPHQTGGMGRGWPAALVLEGARGTQEICGAATLAAARGPWRLAAGPLP